jgi:feruloyl esterase
MQNMPRAAAIAAAALFATWWVSTERAQAGACENLSGRSFGNATITAADAVTPPFTIKDEIMDQQITVSLPFCRTQGTIKPSPDSDIRFELWLPQDSAWNGKYEGVGNGGFAGSISYHAMAWAVEAGYSASGTDTGHVGLYTDASWARDHPERIVDWAWRAIHETASRSKAIVQTHYSRPPAHAYFSGCSDGGREALIEAQRFPEDYDGIVAAAPAIYWNRNVASFVWNEQALTAEPGGALPPKKLSAVTAAVLVACHGEDDMLSDPGQCRFDPSVLICKGAENDSCLTGPQVTTLKKIYAGTRNAAGELLFPGYQPGSEASWNISIIGDGANPGEGSDQLALARGFFGDMVLGKPGWDIRTMNFDDDLKRAEVKTAPTVDAANPDLGRFKATGGKLIQYHGWNDSMIPAPSSIHYYEEVASKMGGVPQIQSFYRLFIAPGMEHCGGGVGPNAVGGLFNLPAPKHDAEHDVVGALAHWVEDGVPPAQIVATKYHDDDPTKGIAMQRPWCPYPAAARYSGQGRRSEADSFQCTAQ